jgi:hypothetical protein
MREPATREQILGWWNDGWSVVLASIEALIPEDLDRTVTIRGEEGDRAVIGTTLAVVG